VQRLVTATRRFLKGYEHIAALYYSRSIYTGGQFLKSSGLCVLSAQRALNIAAQSALQFSQSASVFGRTQLLANRAAPAAPPTSAAPRPAVALAAGTSVVKKKGSDRRAPAVT
jgi:hypothetical protein